MTTPRLSTPRTPGAFPPTPLQALAAWPQERPLAALITGQPHAEWGRLSVLAEPAETHVIPWPEECAHLTGTTTTPAVRSTSALAAGARRALEQLHRTLARHAWFMVEPRAAGTPHPVDPLHWRNGLWMMALCYEWGGLLEAKAMPRHRAPPDGWPLAVLCWCPAPYVYLHDEERWLIGPPPRGAPRAAAGSAPDAATGPSADDGAPPAAEITHLEGDAPRAAFEEAVARTVEYIRAGDIFQANVAQRFSARWRGSPRAIAHAAFAAASPRYGAYLETPTHALASMSPELFLQATRDGTIVTRPIKGTAPCHDDPAALMASSKEAAELHMIVDLMRNDLGRLCVPGSVRVRSGRVLESHATVHHGVAEVHGTLRANTALPEILRGAFPPGSVTGAPKVRAMQVIDELEPVSRGPYCGAIGAMNADGLLLNVGIRTVCMHRDPPRDAEGTGGAGGTGGTGGTGGAGGAAPCRAADTGTLRYSAGCGIVAESEPVREYEESLHKTAVLLRTAHALQRAR